jgi:hypothetical protein
MGSNPTLIIPPDATVTPAPAPTFTPSYTVDEVDLLEAILLFYQQEFPNWNVTPVEEAKFKSLLAKTQALQL